MKSLLLALQFLTVIPIRVSGEVTSRAMGQAVGWFPLVGVLLGGLLVGLDRGLTQVFPIGVSAVLVLAAWVAATGALHLDGFLDSCDGLFGGHTPDSRLRIMRDERVGAFGLAGGVLLLLLKYAALAVTAHPIAALFLAPTLGRWGMALAVVAFPYARPEGLGRAMQDHAGWRQVALATGIAWAAVALAGGWMGLVAVALAGALVWAVGRFVLARLPGLTGDVYGAICEMVEALVLLFFAVKLL